MVPGETGTSRTQLRAGTNRFPGDPAKLEPAARLAAMTILDDARPGMDLSVRPQDDLFAHVNGRWLETEEIPADKSRWGAFSLLAERSEQQVRDIAEECAGGDAPKGSPTQQIGDL